MCRTILSDRISSNLLVVELFFSSSANFAAPQYYLIWKGILTIGAQILVVATSPVVLSHYFVAAGHQNMPKYIDFRVSKGMFPQEWRR